MTYNYVPRTTLTVGGPFSCGVGSPGNVLLAGYYAPFLEALAVSRSTLRTRYGKHAFRTVELAKRVRLGLAEDIY